MLPKDRQINSNHTTNIKIKILIILSNNLDSRDNKDPNKCKIHTTKNIYLKETHILINVNHQLIMDIPLWLKDLLNQLMMWDTNLRSPRAGIKQEDHLQSDHLNNRSLSSFINSLHQ